MVVIEKTYSRARTYASKIATAAMIAIGFLTLLFNVRWNLPGLDSMVNQTGVAHADATSCSSCVADPCSDFSDTDAGSSGEGSGEGEGGGTDA